MTRYNIITESIKNGDVIDDCIIKDATLEHYKEMVERIKSSNKKHIACIHTNDDESMINIEYTTGLIHVFMLVPVGVIDKRMVNYNG